MLSVLLWYTDYDYPLGIFWPLCCLFFYDIKTLITPLVSFGHCVVCSSMIYRFWLHPWYILAIVLSVLLWFRDCDYPLGIIWPLCCVFFYDIPILIIPLVSFDHCVVCSSMIYRFWLHLWYLLVISSSMIYRFWLHHWCLSAIVLSVLLWYTDSDYTLGIFWSLCCLFFYDIQILIIPLVSFSHCVVCSSMIYRFWLPLGIFWPLCCLFFYDLQILITSLVSFGHCVVCSSMIYRFWLPLGIFWPLCCLIFYDIQIVITPLVSFGNCVVCSSMIYRFSLPPWYLLAIVLSDLLWYTDSDYPLVSFGHCVVCSSMIYRFSLPPWYLLAIVLSVLLWYTDSDYPLGIFWPLCCLFFYDLGILITHLVSFGHCVVCSFMGYGFWLPLWYLLAICSSIIFRFWLHPWYLLAICSSMIYRFWLPLGIFWPLYCLFFYDLQILNTPLVSFGHLFFYDIQILITPLVSFGHCVVCSSMTYRFWLNLWYLLAIVSSVLLWYTDSDYPLGIFWAFCCLFFYDIQILITSLVSFGHCVVYSSMI